MSLRLYAANAIKCCIDEGLEPVCYERSCDIGGLWRYTDTPVEGQGCVMKSTVINTSKEMMSYSDFPIPANYPPFCHNTQVCISSLLPRCRSSAINFATLKKKGKQAERRAAADRSWHKSYRRIQYQGPYFPT